MADNGVLGLTSGLPTFADSMAMSSSKALKLVEVMPTIKYTSWTQDGGTDAYVSDSITPPDITDVPLDCVGVRTLIKTSVAKRGRLTRVETQALCQSTDGSFYWDQVEYLYVHMPDDSDPDGTSVVAEWMMPISAEGGSYPILYGDKVLNGSFEDGSAWGSFTAGNAVVTVNSSDRALKGSKAGKIYSPGTAADPGGSLWDEYTLQDGGTYRVSGAYFVENASEATWNPYIEVEDRTDNQDVGDDGRTNVADGRHQLSGQRGVWHRFVFDFIAWNTGTYRLLLTGWNGDGADSPSGTIFFDNVKLKAVSRFQCCEPRLMSGLPTITSGTHDRAFGGKQIGSATVEFVNADGELYKFWGSVKWIGAEIKMFRGADSVLGTLPRDAFKQVFRGTVSNADADDRSATIQATDFRSFLQTKIPLRQYNLNDSADMESERVGDVRPWLFGSKTNVRPTLIAVSSLNSDYARYELVDITDSPNNLGSAPSWYAYTDEESADKALANRRLSISSGQLGYNGTLGIVDVDFDIQVFRIHDGKLAQGSPEQGGEQGNNKLDFEVGQFAADKVWQVDVSGSPDYSDQTADFNDAGADDCLPFPASEAAGDYFAIGYSEPFDYLTINMGNPVGVGGDFQWQYWNGSGWIIPENIKDNTNKFKNTQTNKVSWDRPSNWATANINGTTKYWIRARILEAYSGTNPVITQGWIGIIYTATLTSGLYFPDTLDNEMQTEMRSESGEGDIFCLYSNNTQKYTISKSAGTLSLLANTGPNVRNGVWPLLGTAGSSDGTGLLSYTGESAVFTSPEVNHFLRPQSLNGFIDDPSGTFTGSASALITKAPDIFRAVYSAFLGRPLDDIDTASFDAARSGAFTLSAYIDSEMTFEEFIERLELSEWAEIQIGEDGKIYFHRLDAAASVVEDLIDADLLSYRVLTNDSDIYQTIRVLYEDDPSRQQRRRLRRRGMGRRFELTEEGPIKSYVASSDDVELQFLIKDSRDFPTYLTSNANATTISGKIDDIAFTSGQFHEISTRKLIDAHAGDDVTLTRAKGGSSTGALSSAACRIQTLSKDYDTGIVRALLLET